MCKDERNIEKRNFGVRNDNDDNDNDDDISNLTCHELRDIYGLHSLPRGGVKSALITRITNHLDAVAPPTIDDEEMIFENIAEDSAGFVC